MTPLSLSYQYNLVTLSCQEVKEAMQEKTPSLILAISETISAWQSIEAKPLRERAAVLLEWKTILSQSEELQSVYVTVVGLEYFLFNNALNYLVYHEEIDILIALIQKGILSLDTPLKNTLPLWFYFTQRLILCQVLTVEEYDLLQYIFSKLNTLTTLDYRDSQGENIFDFIINNCSLERLFTLLDRLKALVIAGVSISRTPKTNSFLNALSDRGSETLTTLNRKFYLKLIEGRLILPISRLFFDLLKSQDIISSYRFTPPQLDLLHQFADTFYLFRALSTPLAEKLLLKQELETLLERITREEFTNCEEIRNHLRTPFYQVLQREAQMNAWIASCNRGDPIFSLELRVEPNADPEPLVETRFKDALLWDRMSYALAKKQYNLALKAFVERSPFNSISDITSLIVHYLLQGSEEDLSRFQSPLVQHAGVLLFDSLSKLELSTEDHTAFYGEMLPLIKELIDKFKKTLAYSAYFDTLFRDRLGEKENRVDFKNEISLLTRLIKDKTRDFLVSVPIVTTTPKGAHYTGIYIGIENEIFFSNTGYGVNWWHPYKGEDPRHAWNRCKFQTVLHVEEASLSDLTNPTLWQRLLDFPPIEELYDLFAELGQNGYSPRPLNLDYERCQRIGSCGPQQLMGIFRHTILHGLPKSLSEDYRLGIYKALKAELFLLMGKPRVEMVDPDIKTPLEKQLTKLENDLNLAFSLANPEEYATERSIRSKNRDSHTKRDKGNQAAH